MLRPVSIGGHRVAFVWPTCASRAGHRMAKTKGSYWIPNTAVDAACEHAFNDLEQAGRDAMIGELSLAPDNGNYKVVSVTGTQADAFASCKDRADAWQSGSDSRREGGADPVRPNAPAQPDQLVGRDVRR